MKPQTGEIVIYIYPLEKSADYFKDIVINILEMVIYAKRHGLVQSSF